MQLTLYLVGYVMIVVSYRTSREVDLYFVARVLVGICDIITFAVMIWLVYKEMDLTTE